ncbi:D-serine ammonia-lyase [Rummeliibacillus stabekisii]|uniref:D-serine ammonia-lyase n=1 Tax=Rummeliibacillus stabekisii TaxID=241244 RepID=UPI00116E210B|nr:D-serine ammonia-lyase [Rummeliibacillus stabekisii]MBB5169082.1 D-serine dehydratase [Rummeliibacillus stabekisii]GEL06432.1 D-serine dehydratase [Rummeliibacillus stabekisii]
MTKNFSLPPELRDSLIAASPVVWLNPQKNESYSIDHAMIEEAEKRLIRFAPYIQREFPETLSLNGFIESPLQPMLQLKKETLIKGNIFIKRDDGLPISGSIKARGGIHEVLYLAEKVALKHHLISMEDDYSIFAEQRMKNILSKYKIVVASTGNLGLSIGIMSRKLGFDVIVHMSHDAKEWKKSKLRAVGAQVIEHAGDYSLAVARGRDEAEREANSYFIDDENSKHLFAGYAVAGRRLKKQLDEQGIKVDANHPLCVYIPCGVGGGPGGVCYGLKESFGENVYCYFVEPTQSPCMLLGMATGQHDQISVYDLGLTNKTIADGLAVGRPSSFAGKLLEPLLDGILTVSDEELITYLKELYQTEGILIEPSAAASMKGLFASLPSSANKETTHIIWATGGSMVPQEEQKNYIE